VSQVAVRSDKRFRRAHVKPARQRARWRGWSGRAVRYALLQVFLAFELFFCVVLLVFREETRALFPLLSVLIANTLAAVAIGIYLWWHHPELRESMRQTPLGAAPVR